jgi:Spy/CpxP family protein refolding chaperone
VLNVCKMESDKESMPEGGFDDSELEPGSGDERLTEAGKDDKEQRQNMHHSFMTVLVPRKREWCAVWATKKVTNRRAGEAGHQLKRRQ